MSRSGTIGISWLIASLWLGFGLANAQVGGDGRKQGQAAPADAAPQPPKTDMQQLLRLWEAQSAKLKTLEVTLHRVDSDPKWGAEEHYGGRAVFQAPQLAFLDFRAEKMKEVADPKDKRKKKLEHVMNKKNLPDSVPFETILCTGEEVWQYRYDVRKIYIFPLDKNQRKRALEEGPLPFLFNMKAAEANRRYVMAVKAEDESLYLVAIQPLLKEDQDTFSLAWIYLDKNYLLPKRIYLVGPDGHSSKDFQISHIKANEPVNPNLFVGVNPNRYFKVERNPGGAAPAPRGRANRQQPVQNARQVQPGGGDQPR